MSKRGMISHDIDRFLALPSSEQQLLVEALFASDDNYVWNYAKHADELTEKLGIEWKTAQNVIGRMRRKGLMRRINTGVMDIDGSFVERLEDNL